MDKVQKIREEVEKIARSINPYIPDEEGKNSEYEAGRFAMVIQIMQIIDSMQEEPVVPKVMEDILNAKTAAESLGISQEEHDRIVDELIYDKESELVNEDDLSEKKDYRERYKRIAESEEFRKNYDSMSIGDIVPVEGEEPVSEDLEEFINTLSKRYPEVSFAKLSRIAVRVSRWQQNQDVKNKLPKVTNRTNLDEYAYQVAYDLSNDWAKENPTWHDVEMACKLGAKWQKQQDQSTIELAEDHAMFAGMEKMKEQMMAKAIDGVVTFDYYNGDKTYGCIAHDSFCLEDFGLKDRDVVKVIVIKEG